MEAKIKEQITAVFTNYLEANRCRKTTERYTILDTICDMKGRFTLEELGEQLAAKNFIVSRSQTVCLSVFLFRKTLQQLCPCHYQRKGQGTFTAGFGN